jgi:hypothetical protein
MVVEVEVECLQQQRRMKILALSREKPFSRMRRSRLNSLLPGRYRL